MHSNYALIHMPSAFPPPCPSMGPIHGIHGNHEYHGSHKTWVLKYLKGLWLDLRLDTWLDTWLETWLENSLGTWLEAWRETWLETWLEVWLETWLETSLLIWIEDRLQTWFETWLESSLEIGPETLLWLDLRLYLRHDLKLELDWVSRQLSRQVWGGFCSGSWNEFWSANGSKRLFLRPKWAPDSSETLAEVKSAR